MLFYDTETVGFHGMVVLIQYAEGLDGEVKFFEVWNKTNREICEFIEWMINYPDGLCGFNLVFDHFHLVKAYNTFRLLPPDEFPYLHLDDVIDAEERGRDGVCLKPHHILDLMLYCQQGPYQQLMERKDIVIKRVPKCLALKLVDELDHRIEFRDIFFARSKTAKKQRWVVDETYNKDFPDVKLSFKASRSLKNIYLDASGASEVDTFEEVKLKATCYPEEYGYAPYAKALPYGSRTWEKVIQHHVRHWYNDPRAKRYARNDVLYLQYLYKHFGCPPPDDHNSLLVPCIANGRWRGYPIDVDKIQALWNDAEQRIKKTPTAAQRVKPILYSKLTAAEQTIYGGSTNKKVLTSIAEEEDHPAQAFAKEVLLARRAKEEQKIYKKLLIAKRLHAGFKPIGTLSDRMAGDGDFNTQGVIRAFEVRSCFLLALKEKGESLDGGDFESFEVAIADAEYGDPQLHEALLSGRKIHADFGTCFFPELGYDGILANKEIYTKCKSALFAFLYGGNYMTIMERLGIGEEAAKRGEQMFLNKHPHIAVARQIIQDMFCTMKQSGGLGTKITYTPAADKITTKLGFTRDFTLENRVVKELVALAEKPPPEWLALDVRVQRRDDYTQKAGGAVRSALYGAAFKQQGRNFRAAANHKIQALGAGITKRVQLAIWKHQPIGVHEWVVQPMNIHDELMSRNDKRVSLKVKESVDAAVAEFKEIVPLLALGWDIGLESWGHKK